MNSVFEHDRDQEKEAPPNTQAFLTTVWPPTVSWRVLGTESDETDGDADQQPTSHRGRRPHRMEAISGAAAQLEEVVCCALSAPGGGGDRRPHFACGRVRGRCRVAAATPAALCSGHFLNTHLSSPSSSPDEDAGDEEYASTSPSRWRHQPPRTTVFPSHLRSRRAVAERRVSAPAESDEDSSLVPNARWRLPGTPAAIDDAASLLPTQPRHVSGAVQAADSVSPQHHADPYTCFHPPTNTRTTATTQQSPMTSSAVRSDAPSAARVMITIHAEEITTTTVATASISLCPSNRVGSPLLPLCGCHWLSLAIFVMIPVDVLLLDLILYRWILYLTLLPRSRGSITSSSADEGLSMRVWSARVLWLLFPNGFLYSLLSSRKKKQKTAQARTNRESDDQPTLKKYRNETIHVSDGGPRVCRARAVDAVADDSMADAEGVVYVLACTYVELWKCWAHADYAAIAPYVERLAGTARHSSIHPCLYVAFAVIWLLTV